MHSVYIISDLHLGGEYSPTVNAGQRGFRLCTRADAVAQFVHSLTQRIPQEGPSELILNGDTVDFLAERDESSASWSPFTADPNRAVAKLEAIVRRDQEVFDALKFYLESGGRLIVLLGNHDVELSLPSVRAAFRRALGVQSGHDFEFLYDGEAYIIGEALIEHGNRYDAWNQIDYDGLRRVRSILSRRLQVSDRYRFCPPPGSDMVASIINPIKLQYPFVDLLKPETAAVVPMLLALEPGYRTLLGRIAALAYQTRGHGLASSVEPYFGGDIRAEREPRDSEYGGDMSTGSSFPPRAAQSERDDALMRTVREALGSEANDFLQELEAQVPADGPMGHIGSDIAAFDKISRAYGLAALLFGKKSELVERRLPALLKAMRGLQDQDTFDSGKETATEYLNAARTLGDRGFRYVVFGHTHLAKQIDLGNGRWYLNSGTWADILRFPIEILKSDTKALDRLRIFVDEMRSGDFSHWTLFNPTYVRLDLDDAGKINNGSLQSFP